MANGISSGIQKSPKRLSGVTLIKMERYRQIRKLGWSRMHDLEHHAYGQLAEMGAFLAAPASRKATFGEGEEEVAIVRDLGWDITPHDRINELVKAGALIAAEIDRLTSSLGEKQYTAANFVCKICIPPSDFGTEREWHEHIKEFHAGS